MIAAAAGSTRLLLERLGRDHARIAGVVKRLAVLADDLDGEPDWSSIAELMEFLVYYADKVHHPLEDRIFDHLINRGLTPTERHLVFNNLGQHEEIAGRTDALARTAADAVNGVVVDVAEFQEALAAFIALQARHMRFEEHQLFPLLDQGLESSDWNALTRIVAVPEQEQPSQAGGETYRPVVDADRHKEES